MNASLLILVLAVGGPCDEPHCLDPAQHYSHTLRAAWPRHKLYHERVYYGYYERPLYDYRTQFDYPWYSGPSRMHWPIAPPPIPHAYSDIDMLDHPAAPVEHVGAPQVRRLPPPTVRATAKRPAAAGSGVANSLKNVPNPLR